MAILCTLPFMHCWSWRGHGSPSNTSSTSNPGHDAPPTPSTATQPPKNEDSRIAKIRNYIGTSKFIPAAQKKQINDTLNKLSPKLSASKLKIQQSCGQIWMNVQILMKLFGSHPQTAGANAGTDNAIKILEPFLGKLGLSSVKNCTKPQNNSANSKGLGGAWKSFTSSFSKVKQQVSSFANGGKAANVNTLNLGLAASMAYCKVRGWQYCCPVTSSSCP